MSSTYNQILKQLENFADGHLQVHDFGNGDFHEITSREFNGLDNTLPRLYPLMWCNVVASPLSGKVDNLTFEVCFMDLVKKGERDEDEVLSDMREIWKDFKAHFQNNPAYTYTLEDTLVTNPFTERFDDELSGWTATVVFRESFSQDRCQIPAVGFPPAQGGQADILIIKGLFDTSQGSLTSITIDGDNEGTYNVLTDDGSSGTVTVLHNASPIVLPATLAIGDTLSASRTITTSSGFYRLST